MKRLQAADVLRLIAAPPDTANSPPACADAPSVEGPPPSDEHRRAVDRFAGDMLDRRDEDWRLRRAMSDHERAALVRRRNELSLALSPHNKADEDRVALALSDFLDAYPAKRLTGAAAAAKVQSLIELWADYPAWAIVEACALARLGKAQVWQEGDGRQEGRMRRLPTAFMPNDGEMSEVIERLVKAHLAALTTIEMALKALPPAPKLPAPACAYFPIGERPQLLIEVNRWAAASLEALAQIHIERTGRRPPLPMRDRIGA